MTEGTIEGRGWEAYLSAVGGAPELAAPIAIELRAGGVAGEAWAQAIEVALWQALPQGAFPATPERVQAVGRAGGAAASGASVTCVEGTRTAWLLGREDMARVWAELAAALPDAPAAQLAMVRLFELTVRGEWALARQLAVEAERIARAEAKAPYVVEATALGALAALAMDDDEEGLAVARRAVRMARTEGLAQPSYLAGAILARARRLLGHFHLSSRILESLARVAPRLWRVWLDWERSLAGVPPQDAQGPAASLNRWIAAFCAGDELAIASLHGELLEQCREGTLPRRDVEALAIVTGVGDGGGRQCEFRQALAPQRATGFEGLPRPLGEHILAIVEVGQDGAAARRLALGAALAAPLLASSRPGRPEAAMAALALAGPEGCEVSALFRHVYGFEFVRERHENVFDVALHRARALLGDRGELRREGDLLRFVVHQPFSVPDTALQGSPAERVLHSLSIRARGSAREIAEDLQMPLRTVQSLLRELLEQGACTQQRASRRVEYVVEDTTFKEPTSPGWSPGDFG